MENHIEKLEKHCRLCGQKFSLNRGYQNPKEAIFYRTVLLDFFNIDPALDDVQVFPKHLCNTCKKKMDQLVKTGKPKGIKLFPFEAHNDSCNICHPQGSSSKSHGSFYTQLEKSLNEIGFVRFRTMNDEKIYYKPQRNNNDVTSEMTLIISKDMKWTLTVKGKSINQPITPLQNFEDVITLKNFRDFVQLLASLKICEGNDDFPDVAQERIHLNVDFFGTDKSKIAVVETVDGKTLSKQGFNIIRSVACPILIDKVGKCNDCKEVRKKLHAMRGQKSSGVSSTSSSSKVNYRYQQSDELRIRLANTQAAKQAAVKKVHHLSEKLLNLINKQEVSVTTEQHSIITDVLKKEKPDFEQDTPMQLLWEQQKERISKPGTTMRWHPLIIRWCLSIFMSSPATYRHIASKRNNFLVLPHVNTLKKYINFTKPMSGFNPDIIKELVSDSKLSSLADFQKNVSILFDEMKIQANLVYRKSTGKIIGFTEMGNINDEISQFQLSTEHESVEDASSKRLAQYVNVFMVRGIFSNLCYPFGFYSSKGFKSDELFPIVWEATGVLESIGFKVRAWVCDGASPNRRFMKINADGENFNSVENIFARERRIYFISDVPHLLKTTRNNLENSHGNNNTKNLVVDGLQISWNHIVNVYEWDLEKHSQTPGLRFLPKLKEEHVNLTSRGRMSVKKAAQVLSSSVANALELQASPGRSSTIKFIRLFDRAFDCLNVSRVSFKVKDDLKPYRSADDLRFEFLESVLQYLDNWRNQVSEVANLSADDRNKCCLSRQTDFGWHMTIRSFIDLAKQLFIEDSGIKFLLSEKFSQDPLEEHFAKHRRIGGCSENPSLDQFHRQEIALNVMNSDLISDLRGNTQGRPDTRPPISTDDKRLPKKST